MTPSKDRMNRKNDISFPGDGKSEPTKTICATFKDEVKTTPFPRRNHKICLTEHPNQEQPRLQKDLRHSQ
jgi:hypothetical protein